MIERQGADFRNAESVPVGEKQQATIALLVPAAAGRALDQQEHLAVGQMLAACLSLLPEAVVHRFAVFPIL